MPEPTNEAEPTHIETPTPRDEAPVKELLQQLLRGETSLIEVCQRLTLNSASLSNSEDSDTSLIPGAAIDVARATRCGFPEVVYGPGKPPELVVRIFASLMEAGQSCLATRLSAEQSASLKEAYPAAVINDVAGTARIDSPTAPGLAGRVTVVTAGSADRPVAEEAIETLHWMRCHVELIDDIGVAGPQRLLSRVPDLRKADALVVAAGMEGALPSVVAGHVSCPIFAVPTSTGYGTSFGGISALLSMLNSCASNVAVVNIDAGFRAAYLAGMVARRVTS